MILGQVERFAWRRLDRSGPCRLRGSLGKGRRGERGLVEEVKVSHSRRLEMRRCEGPLESGETQAKTLWQTTLLMELELGSVIDGEVLSEQGAWPDLHYCEMASGTFYSLRLP